MVAEENIGAQEEAELWSRLENAEEVRKYLPERSRAPCR